MSRVPAVTRRGGIALLAGALAAPGLATRAGAAEKSAITVGRAYGLIYMATYVMEGRKLVEQHARALGVPDPAVEWKTMGGGGAVTDMLLAGGIDVVCSGIGNLLLLWDRTKGGVKGICSTSAQPLDLITRDPSIKSMRDLALPSKIAVPTVKVSTHAVLLQIEAAKLFGPADWAHFDPLTVQLPHPDAVSALMNPRHEVSTHFSAIPYSYFEMRQVPNARVLIRSNDIAGGPVAAAQLFVTTRFADANPLMVRAIKAAATEAVSIIRNDTGAAVDIYRQLAGDKMPREEILAALAEPGMLDYMPDPLGTMTIATHMANIGTLKARPKAWTDYYLPIAHDLAGT